MTKDSINESYQRSRLAVTAFRCIISLDPRDHTSREVLLFLFYSLREAE